MKRIALASLGLILVACASTPETKSTAASPASSDKFQAKLDAAHEVPSPSLSGTSPSGNATFTPQGNALVYKISVTGLSSPYVAAHIHTGAPGVAGPVIVPLVLTPGPGEGSASGEGTVDAAAIKGKNADGSAMSMTDLLAAMRSGNTYVNVHTANNKAGEARGQIQP